MDTYAAMRDRGRVGIVKFAAGEADEAPDGPRNEMFARESFFITHYDDVVATLLDDRFSVDPRSRLTPEQREQMPEGPEEFRPLARSLLSIDPPDHTRIRKLVQPSFTGRGMEAMRAGIQQVVDALLDRAEREAAARGETAPNRRMELIRSFAYPFPVTVISDMLGIPREDREQIRGWTENLLRVDRGRDRAMDEEVRQGLSDFTAYLRDLFARKRRQPTDDMISRMVLAEEDDDVLTEEEILATVFLMYLAGHVTTVNLIGNGVVALLTHPEQFAKLQADPTWPGMPSRRRCAIGAQSTSSGVASPRRTSRSRARASRPGIRSPSAWPAANRDPERFAAPDTFDISRPDANRHVAFGKGIHVCLGAPLARVEGQSPSRR